MLCSFWLLQRCAPFHCNSAVNIGETLWDSSCVKLGRGFKRACYSQPTTSAWLRFIIFQYRYLSHHHNHFHHHHNPTDLSSLTSLSNYHCHHSHYYKLITEDKTLLVHVYKKIDKYFQLHNHHLWVFNIQPDDNCTNEMFVALFIIFNANVSITSILTWHDDTSLLSLILIF